MKLQAINFRKNWENIVDFIIERMDDKVDCDMGFYCSR